ECTQCARPPVRSGTRSNRQSVAIKLSGVLAEYPLGYSRRQILQCQSRIVEVPVRIVSGIDQCAFAVDHVYDLRQVLPLQGLLDWLGRKAAMLEDVFRGQTL